MRSNAMRFLALALVVAAAGCADRPPAAAAGPGASAGPDPAAAERLYLLYNLERLHFALPRSAADGARFLDEAGAVRAADAAHLADLHGRGFDPAVAALYEDLVAEADGAIDLAADFGRIDRRAADRKKVERAEGGFRAGLAGGRAGASLAGLDGVSTGEAAAGAVAAGVAAYFLDDLRKSKERDEAVRTAREALARDFGRKSADRRARLRAEAGRLAAAHGWPRGSVPVLDPAFTAADLDRLARAGDGAAVVRFADAVAARRPRDPAAVLDAAVAALDPLAAGEAEPGRLGARAKACAAAVALVPPGRAYDPMRVALWAAAAWLELTAAEAGDRDAAGRALAAAAAALALDPADADGDLRALRAFALEEAGERAAAYAAAGEVAALKKSDVKFAIRYTALAAEVGDPAVALAWAAHLVTACGFEDVALLRRDPTMARAARHDPKEWARLTVPKWTWNFLPRVLRDEDIALTNDSPFPLTNVVFRPVVEKGGRRWTPELKADRVPPGRTYTWKNVFRYPGGPPDKTSSTMGCDQSPPP